MPTNWKRTVHQIVPGLRPVAVDGQAYGVEVELEGVYNFGNVNLNQWSPVQDGSLREGGMEFITPPVTAQTARESVRDLYVEKERGGWTGGQRCGIHVHMDMTNRTMRQLHAILVAYACVEPVLFHYCGPEREQNIFCIPWYRAQTGLREATEMIYHPIRDRLARLRRAQSKYTALYLEPLARFGTIEFRGAPVFQTFEEFDVFFTALEELVTNTETADAGEILDLFLDDPELGLRVILPSSVGHGDLIEEADSPAVAASLVRTKSLPPTWEFLGLNVDDTAPRERNQPEDAVRLRRPGQRDDGMDAVLAAYREARPIQPRRRR